jgi:outer membrane beta-barrel protein
MAWAGEARAEEVSAAEARPTIQDRFAPKAGLVYGQVLGMLHVRDDYYDTWGVGGEVGYFFVESLGVDVRVVSIQSSLAAEAIDLKERIGLTPDARPQDLWVLAGVRWAPGYGKLLMFGRWVQHLDPQLVAHGGVARADTGWFPMAHVAFSTMLHFKWGIKANIDLGASFQWEDRARGRVFSAGFAPSLGVGWGTTF